MKRSILSGCCLLICACGSVQSRAPNLMVSELPALPRAITNNAATSVRTDQGEYLLSFNGLGAGRQWHDTVAHTYVLAPQATTWQQLDDVPGGHGRLASVAVSVGPNAYVFGGYTVAEDHAEVSLPLVHRFDPVSGTFVQLASMPVPVDDAVALVYQDRYIYLISGWHDKGNVNLSQRYDTVTDQWIQATPFPGNPVFGHAGGIVDNTMVICDGVKIHTHATGKRDFVMEPACFTGTVDPDDSRSIDWHTLPAHPGKPRYRMAAAGVSALNAVVFIGGSDNPYNYDGIGYNGVPSVPVAQGFTFDLSTRSWKILGNLAQASMDHRGLVSYQENWITIGGLFSSQHVTDHVHALKLAHPF